MINTVPDSWKYTPDMENLFYFYQCSEELLSFNSPDSFRLPVCNCMTLCSELRHIFSFLDESKQIDKFYSKYIPVIIDELLKNIKQDHILKQSLGLRLESIINGLLSAKSNPKELVKWINVIEQSCTAEHHKESCEKEIIQNVRTGNNKKELLWLIQNYYIDLMLLGYSTEYLYQTTIRFFDNRKDSISSPSDIESFLSNFDCTYSTYEFYVIADTFKLDNLSRISPQIGQSLNIQEIDESKILEKKRINNSIRIFLNNYEELKNRGNSNIKMLSCSTSEIDPYSAFDIISLTFDLAQCFEGYFKHSTERRIFFDILLVADADYIPIKLRRIIPKRPYIDQPFIDKRIDTILKGGTCRINVMMSLFKAMNMHLDAINCKNEETMLRSFWTALEALFFTSNESEEKENAKYCLLHIVQKTYILKQFRWVYEQLIAAIDDSTFWQNMGISSFEQFVNVFMAVQADDPGFRCFTNQLQQNPLLRSRIYWFRKELCDCESIRKKVEDHREKVSWQIDRIYRTRNLSTHAGEHMPYINEILFNLHNYFDYAVNYIICKMENNSYIQSIPALIFEAKNDNQIHISFLKKTTELESDNYLYALFGPDIDIISFEFEAILSEGISEM